MLLVSHINKQLLKVNYHKPDGSLPGVLQPNEFQASHTISEYILEFVASTDVYIYLH